MTDVPEKVRLSGGPTHVHVNGGLCRFVLYADGRAHNHEPWTAGVIYEGQDGRWRWTGSRFTAPDGEGRS